MGRLLGHIIYIAANGADGETGYPPVSREAAGLALAAFFLRPDAAAVARMLPTGLHMHMRDAVLTLLNGKLARIRASTAIEPVGRIATLSLPSTMYKRPMLCPAHPVYPTSTCTMQCSRPR